MLDISKIKAITLDLDDTLWPIWPVIERAEDALGGWLRTHAPATAQIFADAPARLRLREQVVAARPDLGHNMSALRLEVIRQALASCGEDTGLAPAAFDVFFDARMKVDLFDDALPALEFLAARFPLVAVSNGNADVHRVGIGHFFHSSVSAHEFGVGKPDPRIFHAAAQSAGYAASEVLHIGDDTALDVQGALAVGMQTVWVNRQGGEWPHDGRPHLTVSTLAQVVELWRPV
jgi:FMN hydrolase / 5-amino-6-(5-phospho-D-ribitylamino)uracil phosphatase